MTRPYLAYKPSGVAWLGDVPAHWALAKMKYLFTERVEKGFADEPLLAATQTKGVVTKGQFESRTVLALKDLHLLKLVEKGDFVISLRSFQGGIEYAHERGIISPAYTILRPRPSIDPDYFRYLFKSAGFIDQLSLHVTGIRQGQNINYVSLARTPLPVPQLDEQAAIVRYLDAVDRGVRRYIRAKRRLIELLTEQKQAIIHHAVTQGLDPSAPRKPSGVEWLGKVPQHWNTGRLGQLTSEIGDGLHGTPDYVDESPYHFINGNNLVDGSVKITSSARCVSQSEYLKYYIPLDESTLLLSINGTIGNVASYQGEAIILGKSAAYIKCRGVLSRGYLLYLLQSAAVRELFKREATGTTILNLSLASIRDFRMAVPPFSEQIGISSFLDQKTTEFSKAVEGLGREIDLMREYRTRLIADVVTGKLDVRDAALPASLAADTAAPDDLAADLADVDAAADEDPAADLEDTPDHDDD